MSLDDLFGGSLAHSTGLEIIAVFIVITHSVLCNRYHYDTTILAASLICLTMSVLSLEPYQARSSPLSPPASPPLRVAPSAG